MSRSGGDRTREEDLLAGRVGSKTKMGGGGGVLIVNHGAPPLIGATRPPSGGVRLLSLTLAD